MLLLQDACNLTGRVGSLLGSDDTIRGFVQCYCPFFSYGMGWDGRKARGLSSLAGIIISESRAFHC